MGWVGWGGKAKAPQTKTHGWGRQGRILTAVASSSARRWREFWVPIKRTPSSKAAAAAESQRLLRIPKVAQVRIEQELSQNQNQFYVHVYAHQFYVCF